jgi:hypothetical protein
MTLRSIKELFIIEIPVPEMNNCTIWHQCSVGACYNYYPPPSPKRDHEISNATPNPRLYPQHRKPQVL